MRLSLNNQTNPTMEKGYKEWLAKKYPKGTSEKFTIGAGILCEIACKYDLCMENAIEDGEAVVCGNPTWTNKGRDPYHCDSCCKRKGAYREQMEITEKSAFADLVRKMKTDLKPKLGG